MRKEYRQKQRKTQIESKKQGTAEHRSREIEIER